MTKVHVNGPWSAAEIERFLAEQVIPIRLGCVTGSGWPLVASLWYVYRDDLLWCATQASAGVVKHLRADSRCSFEVATNAPPYRGVRGQGHAYIDPSAGEGVLRTLVERYLGTHDSAFARWLLQRADSEVAIRIEPRRLRSWDFSRRMASALSVA